MPIPTDVPSAVLFVLNELRSYTSSMRPGAQTFAEKFIQDFGERHPRLIKPGDDDGPEPPARGAIDDDIDSAIDHGDL
jgi:hypothetical protein